MRKDEGSDEENLTLTLESSGKRKEREPISNRGKRKQWPSQTLTLTLIGKSDEIRTNESKERGRKGRGWPTSPLRGTAVMPARGEEKGRLGALLAGTGHNGAVVRPLDGGALTRCGARTQARGPATAPGLAACSRRGLLARSVTD